MRQIHSRRRPGEIVGQQLRPFNVPWPQWNAREIGKHTRRLRKLEVIDERESSRIEEICDPGSAR
jgi:hypothetical protein